MDHKQPLEIEVPLLAYDQIVSQAIRKCHFSALVNSEEEAFANIPPETPHVAPKAETEAMPAAEATGANVGAKMPVAAAKAVGRWRLMEHWQEIEKIAKSPLTSLPFGVIDGVGGKKL